MGLVAGVLDDPPGFPYTPPGVDVLEGGKLTCVSLGTCAVKFLLSDLADNVQSIILWLISINRLSPAAKNQTKQL